MANPLTRPARFKKAAESVTVPGNSMTAAGTAQKTAFLLGLVITAAYLGAAYAPALWPVSLPILIIAFGIGLVAALMPAHARLLGPIYAVLEGLLVGLVSWAYEAEFPGIVQNALWLTFLVAALMLVGYWRGLIRVTETVRTVVAVATTAIAALYLVDLLWMMLGGSVVFIHDGGPMGILFSVAVVIVAAYNLALDFANIEEGIQMQSPAYMEWYGAFGIIVTLIWLYLEILRLLGKLKRR